MSEEHSEYKIEGRPSTIFRTVKNKDNPYVMIDRRPLDNPALSFKAKGILTYLMSRPNGWEVCIIDLAKRSTEGISAIRSGLKELRNAGHMRYIVDRAAGRFIAWRIEVYEIPKVGIFDSPPDEAIDELPPFCDYPQVDKPQVENHTQVLKELSNNEFKKENANALSFKNLQKANQKMDAILKNERVVAEKQNNGWPGREKMPESIRDLLDMYVELTGQKPGKAKLMDWLSTGQEWLEMGIQSDDLRMAYKAARPGKGNGFLVTRPGSLTSVAHEIQGKLDYENSREYHPTSKIVD
jgi:hypothetical protein